MQLKAKVNDTLRCQVYRAGGLDEGFEMVVKALMTCDIFAIWRGNMDYNIENSIRIKFNPTERFDVRRESRQVYFRPQTPITPEQWQRVRQSSDRTDDYILVGFFASTTGDYVTKHSGGPMSFLHDEVLGVDEFLVTTVGWTHDPMEC